MENGDRMSTRSQSSGSTGNSFKKEVKKIQKVAQKSQVDANTKVAKIHVDKTVKQQQQINALQGEVAKLKRAVREVIDFNVTKHGARFTNSTTLDFQMPSGRRNNHSPPQHHASAVTGTGSGWQLQQLAQNMTSQPVQAKSRSVVSMEVDTPVSEVVKRLDEVAGKVLPGPSAKKNRFQFKKRRGN